MVPIDVIRGSSGRTKVRSGLATFPRAVARRLVPGTSPECGGYLVASWLASIVLNLVTANPPHYP